MISYECSCPFGFKGKNCQDQLNICSLYEPCSNGATCTNLQRNISNSMYKCSCAKGIFTRYLIILFILILNKKKINRLERN